VRGQARCRELLPPPWSKGREQMSALLVDEYLPVYDVSDGVATVVETDTATVWNALMNVDLIDVGRLRPLVGVLGAVRMLPEIVSRLLNGEAPPPAPARLRLRDMATLPRKQGGWILLGERPCDEIALGLVGRFWLPVIEYAEATPQSFVDFNEPGYAKTIYSLTVRALDERRTMLAGVMRTATTDEHARRCFRRYWTLGVGSGAHVLVNGLLDVTRELAESGGRA
jgi:hypothetical protein